MYSNFRSLLSSLPLCQRLPQTYRVTVVEWLAHTVVLTAPDADAATESARQLWLDGKDDDRFEFEDSDLDIVIADEI